MRFAASVGDSAWFTVGELELGGWLVLMLVLIVLFRKWKPWTTVAVLGGLFTVFAAVQVGLVYAIRPAYARGLTWPVTTVGIIAFILLIAAYLPIPFELLKRRGRVVGIDFIFLAIDWCGAFFSLMSLVAQHEFDVLFGTMYALWLVTGAPLDSLAC